jgi:rhodanese-related sulfurtransferase
MIDEPIQPPSRRCGCPLGKIALEAALVGVLGAAFGFLANQLSPRGLDPARNYFPGGGKISPVPLRVAVPPPAPGVTNVKSAQSSASVLLKARLEKEGLHLLERAEVEKLFHDPRLAQHEIMFIDARDGDDYQQGHIPGAFEFYPYYPEKYLADVLTPCDIAGQIVVYCTGGDCEDSESAALFLSAHAGVPAGKLFIYGGGITEWEAAALPVESGPRDSGSIRNPSP